MKPTRAPRVTADFLRKNGACPQGLQRFTLCFPRGLAITTANYRAAIKAGHDAGFIFGCLEDWYYDYTGSAVFYSFYMAHRDQHQHGLQGELEHAPVAVSLTRVLYYTKLCLKENCP